MNKKNTELVHSSSAEYLTYIAANGTSPESIEIRYENENIWLSQKMMAELYDVTISAINQHIKKVLEDGELSEDSVIKKYLITAADGKKYSTNHYNLQMIIAVGFKVNNERAVQFRKWAIQIGKISAEESKLHAETEYEKYRIVQDKIYKSDFDRFLELEEEINKKD